MSSDAAKNAYPNDDLTPRSPAYIINRREREAYDRGQSDLTPSREIVEAIRYALVWAPGHSKDVTDDAFAWIDQFVTWDEMGG